MQVLPRGPTTGLPMRQGAADARGLWSAEGEADSGSVIGMESALSVIEDYSNRASSATQEYDNSGCYKSSHLDVDMLVDENNEQSISKEEHLVSFDTPLDSSYGYLEAGSNAWKPAEAAPHRPLASYLSSVGKKSAMNNMHPRNPYPNMMWKANSFGSQGSSQTSAGGSEYSGNYSQPQQTYVVAGTSQEPSALSSMIQDYGQMSIAPMNRSESASRLDNYSQDCRWQAETCVEKQAQAYRSAASGATPAAVWSGVLPPRNTKGSAFSCKVFLGGVPWDITEKDLHMAFGKFGNPKIEWPASHDNSNRNVKGHLYLIFDTEKSVKQLLGSCNYDFNAGHHNWYFKVASKRMRVKEVQVIPWQLADASYVKNGCMTTLGTKTVFVGSLHGMLTAEGLAKVLDDLFGGVVAATIDTDKYKYPIGSGRVTFNSNESYMKALRAVFVDLRTPKFNKKIQIDPFLEDSPCSLCHNNVGPYFCRDLSCFNYFCHSCWQWQHSSNNNNVHHIPLMRNPRV